MLRARLLGLVHPGLKVGGFAEIGGRCRVLVERGGRVVLRDRVTIGDGVTLGATTGALLELGERSVVGQYCTIAARDRIVIGPRTMIAEHVSIRDHDHDPDLPPTTGAALIDPVQIGCDVWIAAKATVVRGTTIGDRAVIAANSVVTSDVEADCVVGGVPARLLRRKRP